MAEIAQKLVASRISDAERLADFVQRMACGKCNRRFAAAALNIAPARAHALPSTSATIRSLFCRAKIDLRDWIAYAPRTASCSEDVMDDRPRRIWPTTAKVLLAAILLLGILAVLDHLTGGTLRGSLVS